ncbi:MAG: glutamine--fructose-6-phosphate transaminase (isomerizing) [Elusimicrobia bacterium]|nr:glutamine--fructose-6-phosphate transaminase (isomerizing) [Elusimicrobiota bacterium]
MCGIIGYIGSRDATPILLEGLRRLEYRGYDSAGVAVLNGGAIHLRRSVGKLSSLTARVAQEPLQGRMGIGHTRWATHGRPCEENAHPHTDCSQKLVVIHNGIVENYLALRTELQERKHEFRSETDTEVVAHLIEEKLAAAARGRGSSAPDLREPAFFEAVRQAVSEMQGAYALAVLWAEAPGCLIAAKTASPLVVGLGEGEAFVASDVPAFMDYTRRAVFLEDGEIAVLGTEGSRFFRVDGKRVEKQPTQISWDRTMAEKTGYRHFMLKEIHEQPQSVEDTLGGRLFPLTGGLLEKETGITEKYLRSISRVRIIACGTAYHAGLIGRYLLERHARLPVEAEVASEFRYREPLIGPETLVIAVSQSGETADTLAAVKLAKSAGAKVLAVCNVLGSALTRASDFNFYTRCGPEMGVASTKAFIGQVTALYLLTLHVALARGSMSETEARVWVDELVKLPGFIRDALKLDARVQEAARRLVKKDHVLFFGRDLNYPIALEGALKLKEISYIHAEGYAAGEMKHGPIALIDSDMPVVAIATRSKILDKILSNIQEAKARGASLIVVHTEGDDRARRLADWSLPLPSMPEFLSPIANAVPLQLLAYHVADLRGCDVDQPRNLAKSVTVE